MRPCVSKSECGARGVSHRTETIVSAMLSLPFLGYVGTTQQTEEMRGKRHLAGMSEIILSLDCLMVNRAMILHELLGQKCIDHQTVFTATFLA